MQGGGGRAHRAPLGRGGGSGGPRARPRRQPKLLCTSPLKPPPLGTKNLQTFAYGGRAKKLKTDIKAALGRCDVREVAAAELGPGSEAAAALAGLTGGWKWVGGDGVEEGQAAGGHCGGAAGWTHSGPTLPSHAHPPHPPPHPLNPCRRVGQGQGGVRPRPARVLPRVRLGQPWARRRAGRRAPVRGHRQGGWPGHHARVFGRLCPARPSVEGGRGCWLCAVGGACAPWRAPRRARMRGWGKD